MGRRADARPSLKGSSPLLALFAGAAALIAFGPLLVFAPQLFRARVAERLTIEDPAAAVEASALSDVGVVYREAVDRLQIVLIDRRDIIAPAAGDAVADRSGDAGSRRRGDGRTIAAA